jgi:hypothetical protein
MKRFALFAGSSFYAAGGWGDFKGSFDTEDEALAAVVSVMESADWFHVIDTETQKVVAYQDGEYCGGVPDFEDEDNPQEYWVQGGQLTKLARTRS